MTNIDYRFNIGIDISKKKLDISFSDNETARSPFGEGLNQQPLPTKMAEAYT